MLLRWCLIRIADLEVSLFPFVRLATRNDLHFEVPVRFLADYETSVPAAQFETPSCPLVFLAITANCSTHCIAESFSYIRGIGVFFEAAVSKDSGTECVRRAAIVPQRSSPRMLGMATVTEWALTVRRLAPCSRPPPADVVHRGKSVECHRRRPAASLRPRCSRAR